MAKKMNNQEVDIKIEMHRMFEEGYTTEQVSREIELPMKDVFDIYTEWKQQKMDKLNVGDKVCYVLDLKGYNKGLIYGNIILKKVNTVIVESKDNDYIEDALNGKVAVSVKQILKVG